MAKPKAKRRASKKTPTRAVGNEAEAQVSALSPVETPLAIEEEPAVVVEPGAGPEPVVELPKPPAASRRTGARSRKKGPIGWTLELTNQLKAAMAFQALAMEIDQEAGHLSAGLIALMEGQFELAGMNLWHAGIAEAPVPTVQQGFE